jgi:hypothetical protein
MALTVEDGSIVTGADSYINLVDARAILTPLGQDLSANDATAEQQLRNAMNYIESFRSRFIGDKRSREQPLQWPRTSASLDGWLIPSDSIPLELQRSQVFAAYEISQDQDLQANDSGKKIASETLGPMSVSYFENSATESSKVYTRVNDELMPLLESSSNIPLVRT